MMGTLYRCYWRMEKWIVPELRSSQYSYYETLRSTITDPCAWLDLGCGHQMFGEWMLAEQTEIIRYGAPLIGLDPDLSSLREATHLQARAAGSVFSLPFCCGSFHLVTANMVMEHIDDPARALHEIYRVLKPQGKLIFHTTNVGNPVLRLARRLPQSVKNFAARLLEGRSEKDVYPTHYKVNTRADIIRYATGAGFTPLQIDFVRTSAFTSRFGPLALPELLYLRQVDPERWSNIVVVLQKSKDAQ